jgi:hypothetical protein
LTRRSDSCLTGWGGGGSPWCSFSTALSAGRNMPKILSNLACSLLALLPVFVLAQEREVSNAPVETVSMVYVVVFGVIFIGMISGFFFYLFWGERKVKPEQK